MRLPFLSLVGLVLCWSAVAKGNVPSYADLEAEIDEFVEAVLECQEIPGLSLAVVKDGQAYLSKGYGVRDLSTMEPLTNQTLMAVASITKSFTSALVGLLLDDTEGAVTWETPVRDVLGDWFYFHEAERTQKATIRDLLSHRMGMPAHNEIRLQDYSTRELLEKLRFLEFSQEWRESPLYHNLMYGVASYAAETLAGGTSWEDLARERLFRPLGMDSTTFVHQSEDRWEDEFAKGYDEDDGRLREISLEVTKAYMDTVSANGAVASNAEDMAKWIMMHLNDGQNSEGDQVVPPDILRDYHTPVAVLPTDFNLAKPYFPVTYTLDKWALGWMEGYYRDFERSSHNGNNEGYWSALNLLPDLKIGVFSSINRVNRVTQEFIHMYIMDLLMGEEPWVDLDTACMKPEVHQQVRQTNQHPTETTSSDPKGKDRTSRVAAEDEEYVGVYGDYAYGNTTVFINDTSGLLSLSYGAVEWTLMETGAVDVFSSQGLEPFWYWEMTVRFSRTDGLVTNVTLPFETSANPVFVRDRNMSSAPPPPELCD